MISYQDFEKFFMVAMMTQEESVKEFRVAAKTMYGEYASAPESDQETFVAEIRQSANEFIASLKKTLENTK